MEKLDPACRTMVREIPENEAWGAASTLEGYVELGEERTCRTCKQPFRVNHSRACVFHPESFSGETAQRWLAPGEKDGGGLTHYFYSCCGSHDEKSKGCCVTRHRTYDEPGRTQKLKYSSHATTLTPPETNQ